MKQMTILNISHNIQLIEYRYLYYNNLSIKEATFTLFLITKLYSIVYHLFLIIFKLMSWLFNFTLDY